MSMMALAQLPVPQPLRMVVTVLWMATLLASPLAEQATDQKLLPSAHGPTSPAMQAAPNWTVQNDTDYLGAYRYSSEPADGIGECARQCMADAKCVATSWNGPHSRQPNRLCNFDCSTAGKHRLKGEIAAVITARAGDNRCEGPPPPPAPQTYTNNFETPLGT